MKQLGVRSKVGIVVAAALLALFALSANAQGDVLGGFELLTPPNGAVVTDLAAVTEITWTESEGATNYNFGLDRVGGTSHVLNLNLTSEICDDGVCRIAVTDEVRALLINGEYIWRVFAFSGNESEAASNNPFTFTVNVSQEVPILGDFQLIAPANGAVVTDPSTVTQIQWSESANATSYTFNLDRSTDGGTTFGDVLLLTLNAADICTGGTCTINVTPDVQAALTNGFYTWDVTAVNGASSIAASNNPYTFTVQVPSTLGAFQLVSPPNGAVVTDPSTVTQIQWSASANATSYTFNLDRSTDGGTTFSDVLLLNLNAVDICAAGTCTINVTPDVQAALTNGFYRWDVTATNGTNTLGASNNPYTFTVQVPAQAELGAFQLIAPANGAIVTNPSAVTQIQWSASANATSYTFNLDRSTDGGATFSDVLLLTLNAADICAGGTCTINVTPDVQAALTNGFYSWDVTASDGTDTLGASNNPYTFTVDVPPVLGAFQLIAPANGAVVTDPSTVTQIQWSESANATSYTFNLDRSTDGGATFGDVLLLNLNAADICVGGTCTINVTPDVQAALTNGFYRWDVIASAESTTLGASNNPFTFTVNATPAAAFVCRVEAPAQVTAGQSFTASIICDNVPAPGAYGLQVCLDVTGTAVTANGISFTPGSVFNGQTTLALVNELDNSGGCYGISLSGDVAGVSGSAAIASAVFTTTTAGSVNLSLRDVLLGDDQGDALPAPQLQAATVTVLAAPTASLDGSIERQAGAPQGISVTVNGQAANLTPNGDTANFSVEDAPVGAATLTADAPGHLQCESALTLNAGENTLPATITLLAGDADDDGDVDIADSTLIGLAFGTNGAGENTVDLNGDGTVNILDLIFIGLNFDRSGVQACLPTAELGTIVDIAVGDDRFETLVAALTAADLVETLQGAGPFTVFAPTDDAFAALPEGTLDSLLADIPALTNILLYHVASGELDSTQISALPSVTTLQGADVTVEVTETGLVLNGMVNVIIADIPASNGIIHVIDAVLIPPADE